MTDIPKHIWDEMRRLIREGKSAEEVAFMMRLSRELVEGEVARLTTTRRDLAGHKEGS